MQFSKNSNPDDLNNENGKTSSNGYFFNRNNQNPDTKADEVPDRNNSKYQLKAGD